MVCENVSEVSVMCRWESPIALRKMWFGARVRGYRKPDIHRAGVVTASRRGIVAIPLISRTFEYTRYRGCEARRSMRPIPAAL